MRKNLIACMLLCCGALMAAMPMPQIKNVPNLNVKDLNGWCKVEKAGTPVKYAACYDSKALYIIADIQQAEAIYAGSGRGYADYNDGVELRINRGGKYRFLQIYIDAAGQVLVLDQYKNASTGNITAATEIMPGRGFRIFAAIPWDRLTPDSGKPADMRVAMIRHKVLAPFKYDRKHQVVDDLQVSTQVIGGEKVAPYNFKPQKYRVMNYGRSGYSTVEILRFLPTIFDADPKLLILMIGTNDVVYKKKWQTPEQYAVHYRKICEQLKARGCKVILCTIPPCVENVANVHIQANKAEKAQLNTRILRMNDYIRSFGKEFGFAVYDYHKVFTGDLESKASLMRVPANCGSRDGIHPNEAGYKLLAAELKKIIDENNYPKEGIVCVGDSITYGAHMKLQGSVFGDTYPAELLRLLEK